MAKNKAAQWLLKTLLTSAWAPILVLVVYSFLDGRLNGEMIVYPWLDNVAHFSGGFAIAYFFFTALKNLQEISGAAPALFMRISTVGLTAITAIVWELLEYLSDLYLGTHIILGVTDTLSDLSLGILGGAVFIILAQLKLMHGQSKIS